MQFHLPEENINRAVGRQTHLDSTNIRIMSEKKTTNRRRSKRRKKRWLKGKQKLPHSRSLCYCWHFYLFVFLFNCSSSVALNAVPLCTLIVMFYWNNNLFWKQYNDKTILLFNSIFVPSKFTSRLYSHVFCFNYNTNKWN